MEKEKKLSFIISIIEDKLKSNDITWQEVSDKIFNETGIYKSESTWRKNSTEISKIENLVHKECLDDTYIHKYLDGKKEKIKLMDERNNLNAIIRRLSREETLKDIALEVANKFNSKFILPTSSPVGKKETKKEAIVCLSDWHYGIIIDNYWNVFNEDICIDRVNQLKDETIYFCKLNNVDRIHVVNMSDLIAGRIHNSIQYQSRVDVITQIIAVSEILAEFLTDLQNCMPDVDIQYYDCLDNHSRLEPVKTNSLELESLVRIVPWFLKTRLKNNNRITINDNEYGEDIITFHVLGHTVGAVHGHQDSMSSIVKNLTTTTRVNYDLILMGHYHHFCADDDNEVLVVENGTLMGVDSYAKALRKTSKPCQVILLSTPDDVAYDIHRILLK